MKKLQSSKFQVPSSNRDGQSLLEILVALGVGTLLVIAATTIILPSLRTNTQADKVQVSAALGKQLLENVRAFGEGDWHNISNLATSSANKYFLASAASPFAAATGTEGISADGITSGLVGYWKLDESTGTTAYDFSGNNATGTIVGAPTSTTGQVGQALSFNGSSSYITAPNIGSTSLISLTLSAWINAMFPTTSALPLIGCVLAGGGSAARNFQMCVSNGYNGHTGLEFYSVGTGEQFSNNVISVTGWHHYAETYTGGTLNFYQDGVLINSIGSLAALNAGGSGLDIGQDFYNTYFKGSIDDVRIYNRALSATEIKSIYTAGIYTRYFYLDSVGRDAGGNILSSGGTNDPSTEKATVVYGWAGGSTSSFSTYLTRFQNKVFDQTDWSGGPGQEGPATTTNNMFSTSTSIFYATTTGSILIQLP